LRRFEERQRDPVKRWKLSDDDWKNRAKRPLYLSAVEEMLERTDHDRAPWCLIEAESKRYARVKVIETVNARIERAMREWGLAVPA
jgi:polyphosphate kinase 2 (PPK2 family)